MDCSQLVLSVIKDDMVKSSLNPIIYYSIKVLYHPEFSKRSRYFVQSLQKFYDSFGKELNMDEFAGSLSEKQKTDNNFIVSNLLQKSLSLQGKDNIQNSINVSSLSKGRESSINMLFKHDWDWYIDTLLSFEGTYILDREDDYSLLYLIRDYIFNTQDPLTSELMQGYNLFVSSVELMFCLRLVLHFPKVFFMRKEESKSAGYFAAIKDRVCKFCFQWCKVYPDKYNKNYFVQQLVKNLINVPEQEHKQFDLILLSLDEPILTNKYVGLVKLIREGPFSYDIDEITRQFCIIDHTNFSSIPQKDYIDYIVKKEIPESFNKIYKREKHFKCYILIFLMLIENLENQKEAVQNFIMLAYRCKMMNNFQTCYSIISTFAMVGISKKELLWRLIDKKAKEIYTALENEYLEVDLNEKTFFDQMKKGKNTYVPHIDLIKNQINSFIIQIKMSNEEQKVILCKEYREFFTKVVDCTRNKYSFFLINPLNDFLSGGFWEICKTKQWGIKAKYDFSLYADQDSDVEKLFDNLVKLYKKKDKAIA